MKNYNINFNTLQIEGGTTRGGDISLITSNKGGGRLHLYHLQPLLNKEMKTLIREESKKQGGGEELTHLYGTLYFTENDDIIFLISDKKQKHSKSLQYELKKTLYYPLRKKELERLDTILTTIKNPRWERTGKNNYFILTGETETETEKA